MVRRRRYWVDGDVSLLESLVNLLQEGFLSAYEGAKGCDYGSWFEWHLG